MSGRKVIAPLTQSETHELLAFYRRASTLVKSTGGAQRAVEKLQHQLNAVRGKKEGES